MKSLLKLSKTSWLILSAGIFVVVLAGMGLTRSQQLQEQTELNEALNVNETRLNQFNISELQRQRDELQEKIDDIGIQLDEAKYGLRATVESIEVVDDFFFIASKCDVDVIDISSSIIGGEGVNGVNCSTISLSATVSGEQLSDVVDFIISLNNDYTTGNVKSCQMAISEENISVNIQMIVYSYEGE